MQSVDQVLSNALIPKHFGEKVTEIRTFEINRFLPVMRDIISGMSQAEICFVYLGAGK